MNGTLSDMIPYVENADVPFPVLVALQVKNRAEASQYHGNIGVAIIYVGLLHAFMFM